MGTGIGVVILSGTLPLLGVLIGSGSTVFIQRSSARESRVRLTAERREARRAEVKSAVASYLEVAQHLQTQLYAREHEREVPDIPVMVEQIWLAQAQVDIICSKRLRSPLVEYTAALNDVSRHEQQYPSWWEYASPYKSAFLDAVREELSLLDDETYSSLPISSDFTQTSSSQSNT